MCCSIDPADDRFWHRHCPRRRCGQSGGPADPDRNHRLGCLFLLATFLPGLALVVRRQHDIGLSGWFYLLVLIPYVGGLIVFVFTLIPSQKHDNKWGPVPYGVKV